MCALASWAGRLSVRDSAMGRLDSCPFRSPSTLSGRLNVAGLLIGLGLSLARGPRRLGALRRLWHLAFASLRGVPGLLVCLGLGLARFPGRVRPLRWLLRRASPAGASGPDLPAALVSALTSERLANAAAVKRDDVPSHISLLSRTAGNGRIFFSCTSPHVIPHRGRGLWLDRGARVERISPWTANDPSWRDHILLLIRSLANPQMEFLGSIQGLEATPTSSAPGTTRAFPARSSSVEVGLLSGDLVSFQPPWTAAF